MILKLLCLTLVMQRGVGDELLRALEGSHGGNKATMCMGDERRLKARCPAAVWRPRWLVARASCLARRGPRAVRVLRGADPDLCDDLSQGLLDVSPQRVKQWFVHPSYDLAPKEYDLALVVMDSWLTASYDPPVNLSSVHQNLKIYIPWMDRTYASWYIPAPQPNRNLWVAQSDLRLFFTVVILPSVLFMAFFIFVTFCTGTPVKVPYKNINDKNFVPPVRI